jgi:hypothetical protein
MHVVRDAIINKGPDWDLYNNPDTPTAPASPAITGPINLHGPDPEDSKDPKNDEFYVLDEDSDQSEVSDASDVSDADSSDPIQLFSTASRAKKAEIQRCEDQSTVLLAEAETSLLALPSIYDIERTPARWLESPTSLREAKASPFWPW